LPVLVFTPPPGGGDSNTLFFPVAVPPPNDDFINAIAPPGNSLPFTDTQDSTAATTDTGGRIDPYSLVCHRRRRPLPHHLVQVHPRQHCVPDCNHGGQLL